MNLSEALIFASQTGLMKHENVYALSDGHLIVNPGADKIKKYCSDNKLELHTIKGELLVIEDKKKTKDD